MNEKYIKIKRLEVVNNKIMIKLELSEDMNEYFLTKEFVIEYDRNIENVNVSILTIPIASIITPVAWAAGANIYLGEIDKQYLDSLNKIENIFKGWYPQFSFSGKIFSQKVIHNEFDNKGYGLLFSGGVDSMTSYLMNRDKVTDLISIWGLDIPVYENEFWNDVKHRLLDFADEEKINIHFIKSNAQEISNNVLLTRKFGLESWWGSVSHGLILSGLCAPLTAINDIRALIIASSYFPDMRPWGSHPYIDNNVKWSDVNILHVDDPHADRLMSRQEKIKYLKDFSKGLSYLRVCWSQYKQYNCGYCEKCLRTIVGLINEGIDPKICNFEIKDDILDFVKISLIKGMVDIKESGLCDWEDIQNHISMSTIDNDTDLDRKYKSKEFFRWFKTFDLQNHENNRFRIFQKYYYLAKYIGIFTIIRDIDRYLKRMLNEKGLKEKILFMIKNG